MQVIEKGSPDLKQGTRVWYTGDVCNHSGEGEIVSVNPPNRWGPESYNIKLDDGREINAIYASNFEGPGRRFQLASAPRIGCW